MLRGAGDAVSCRTSCRRIPTSRGGAHLPFVSHVGLASTGRNVRLAQGCLTRRDLVLSEAQLQRLRAGDDRFFARIYDVFSPRLLREIRWFTDSPDDAEDILQDVWTRIFASRMSYRNSGTFAGWIWCIARTVCIDRARAHRRDLLRRRVLEGYGLTSSTTPRQSLDCSSEAEIAPWLEAQIRTLPSRQRQVASLRLVKGHSVKTVAAELGIAPGTVKSCLHQARAILRQRLAGPPPQMPLC